MENEGVTTKSCDSCDNSDGTIDSASFFSKSHLLIGISFVLLMTGLIFDYIVQPLFFVGQIRLALYLGAYLPVGFPVIRNAVRSIRRKAFFSEFFLMAIATIGAFFIRQYSEGVTVMLFYTVGEIFQDSAINRAKRSIRALLEIRQDRVNVLRDGLIVEVSPSEVNLGEIIQVKPGEKVALDGDLVSAAASFNTAALTGESKPDSKGKGEKVYAGMINLSLVSEIKVSALFKDSKLSRILAMVQDASARKSQTQLFISRFAAIYTPVVVFLAIGICLVPLFFDGYLFIDWIYRALVFLVISCPCALVISIPLGYFGGIGLASKNGILFKGSNYLDLMTKVDTVIMDKTGTLTKGVFKVQKIEASDLIEVGELVRLTAAIEAKSTHPIAIAIVSFATESEQDYRPLKVDAAEEIAGHGLRGMVDGREVLAGNVKLLEKFGVSYNKKLTTILETIVVVAVNRQYAGHYIVADELKEDAADAIREMHKNNIKTVMLSGDKQSIVDNIAKNLGIDEAFGDLLPEHKVEKLQTLKIQNRTIAFVGDGVNDAPVIALADAGIAMGGLGSDATIETADIVIQNDQPSKIMTAIKIGKITRKIVWQNITLAMAVKAIVLVLGAMGIATLWEAVFADVGVAVLAIANAVRIQSKKF